MDNKSGHTNPQTAAAPPDSTLTKASVTEVEVEPIGDDDDAYPVIPPEKRLSWLGWAVAIAVFIVNKKAGILFFIILLVFGKFPTLNLKNLPGSAGRLIKKLRS